MRKTGKCREYIIEWYKRIIEETDRGNKPSMHRYVRMQRIDVEKCDTGCLKLRNESTTKMRKEAKIESMNDMRNYFATR